MNHRFALTLIVLTLALLPALGADWPTHRGNPERTGNVDGQSGPKTPKVLWVHRTPEQFVASPVAGDKALYLSGLGAFNSAAFHALSLDPAGQTGPLVEVHAVSQAARRQLARRGRGQARFRRRHAPDRWGCDALSAGRYGASPLATAHAGPARPPGRLRRPSPAARSTWAAATRASSASI